MLDAKEFSKYISTLPANVTKSDPKSSWRLLIIKALKKTTQINTKNINNMANTNLKVLGFWVSPFSLRVEWALKLKGIDYEYIEEDIYNKSSQLLELNPVYKKVPVLIHDHKVISESCVILEYIDETWKDKNPILLPRDPYERSMARFWARFGEEKMLENAYMAMCAQGDRKEAAIESTKQALEKIEEVLKGKQNFFGGENIGYLDLVLGWITYWLPVWEQVGEIEILNQTQFPAIISWINNFVNHPVINDKLPPREEMVVYFEERKKVVGAYFAAKET